MEFHVADVLDLPFEDGRLDVAFCESVLGERVVRIYHIEPRAEIRGRIKWVGWKWALRAYRRLLRLLIANPASVNLFKTTGNGLFSGRK